jgi:hypothetical protein
MGKFWCIQFGKTEIPVVYGRGFHLGTHLIAVAGLYCRR